MDTLHSIVDGELSFLWYKPGSMRDGAPVDVCSRVLNVKGVTPDICMNLLNDLLQAANSHPLITGNATLPFVIICYRVTRSSHCLVLYRYTPD